MRTGLLAAAAALVLAAASPASAALIHAYDFNGGIIDLAGSADGALVGNASVAGGVLTLDGAGDYAQFGTTLIPTAGGEFSLFMSVNIGASQAGIAEFIAQGSSGGPGFYIGTNGGSGFRLTDAYGNPGVALPSTGAFHNLFLVNGANSGAGNDGFKFYIDGDLVFTAAKVNTFNVGTTNTRLGAQFDGHGEYFNGQIDNLRVYDGVVTYATASAPLGGGVPEPASWAMMILGFFGAGQLLRRHGRPHGRGAFA